MKNLICLLIHSGSEREEGAHLESTNGPNVDSIEGGETFAL